ncbi:MAG: PQQ-binding-like beta-propeller repeat protein [Coriobacteriia bacterium]|nr:PQQ-binding-like beta-propeller repeat protein [Coriobacteriia bacterium]
MRNRHVLVTVVSCVLLIPLAGCHLIRPQAQVGSAVPRAAPVAPETQAGPPLGPEAPPESWHAQDGIKIASFLGGVHRRTYGRGPVPARLDVIWRYRIGTGETGGPGGTRVQWSGTGWTGQPTLVREGGRDYLLIGGYDHHLRRIDAQTGEEVWRYRFPDVIKGTNTVFAPPGSETDPAGYVVVAGSRRGVGLSLGASAIAPVRGVGFASGNELWRLPVPRTRSYSQDADASPLYVDGRLYVAVESGYVYALEPTGTVAWGEYASPVVVARSPELYDARDIASHGGNLVLESSPVLLGDTIYVAAGSGHVYGLDRDDLSIVWDFFIGSDLDGTVVATADGYLLVAVEKQYIAGSGGVFKLDPRKEPSEAVVWYYPTMDRGIAEWEGGVIGSVAVNDDYDPEWRRPPIAAFNSVDGYLYIVSQDMIDGVTSGPNREPDIPQPRLIHRQQIGGAISTPIIVDDRVVVAGYDGKVRILSLDYEPFDVEAGASRGTLLQGRDGSWYDVTVEETASFSGGGSFESTPIVWEGRVYIGSRDGFLYCLGELP